MHARRSVRTRAHDVWCARVHTTARHIVLVLVPMQTDTGEDIDRGRQTISLKELTKPTDTHCQRHWDLCQHAGAYKVVEHSSYAAKIEPTVEIS
jgi:hypothetical protein